jgi:hypothetical protein
MPLDVVRRQDPEAVREILASVPEWIGIPAANQHDVELAGFLAMNELQRIDRSGPTLTLVKPL